ncbi:transglutaminase domain-containing protein [Chitinophaga solisilvae]|uniref:transglutaminase domain-containing protein n=1 Tax=Chitinophaga solisilvae TaxID=1233460 RepID=UPI001369CEAF|nr:transglutaminase-like domain-containing protein [Chitinophaga solisilvae]
MKYLLCSLYGLLLTGLVQAQAVKKITPAPAAPAYAPIPDSVTGSAASMAGYLAAHHKNQRDMLKSLFGWMSTHITYDMVNTFRPDYYKDSADAVIKTLQTRTAVCQGFAALFTEVSRLAGIPALLLSGYTFSNGRMDNASHAWVAVWLDNQWQIVDPTWGSGYTMNGKYTAKLDWKQFLVAPAVSVKTHVPFDPLFQFSEYPLRHEEIRDAKWTAGAARPLFGYKDTLAAYESATYLDRIRSMAGRIDRYGVTNQLIAAELHYLMNVIRVEQHNQEVTAQNGQVHRLNEAGSVYNMVVNTFNDYVVFKNNQFAPSKPDKEIQEWVNGMAVRLDDAGRMLNGLELTDAANRRVMEETKVSITQLKQRVVEEQAFVAKYVKTGRLFRKSLFYKLVF